MRSASLMLILFVSAGTAVCLMRKTNPLGYEWNEMSIFYGTGLWMGESRDIHDTFGTLDSRHRDGVWGSVRSPLVGLAGCVRRFVTLPDWDVSIVTEPSVCYLEVWVVIAHCVARIQ